MYSDVIFLVTLTLDIRSKKSNESVVAYLLSWFLTGLRISVSHLSMAWYGVSFISSIGRRRLSFLRNLRRPCTILRPIIDSIYPCNRHLDNNFIICNEDNYVNNTLDGFSNCPQPVRLTMKLESDSGFHFLDVLVKKESDGSLQRSWYGKPRWNGQYTNF